MAKCYHCQLPLHAFDPERPKRFCDTLCSNAFIMQARREKIEEMDQIVLGTLPAIVLPRWPFKDRTTGSNWSEAMKGASADEKPQ